MKRSALPFLLLSVYAIFNCLRAQPDPFWQKHRVHITAGVNYPLINKLTDTYEPNASVGMGFGLERMLGNKTGLQLSVGYNGLSYNRNAVDSNENFIQKTKENYADLNLNFLFYPAGKNGAFVLFAGVAPSLLIGKSVNRSQQPPPPQRDPSRYGRVDLSVTAGGQVNLTDHWYIKATYYHSFTDELSTHYNTGRFSMVQVGIGVRIQPRSEEADTQRVNIQDDPQKQFDLNGMHLLVRLPSNSKKIASYLKSGYTRLATELANKTAEENNDLIEAYRTNFDFCPVYFFYDTSSKDIVARHLAGNIFRTANELAVASAVDTTNFLIAEFGSPYSEAFQSSTGYGLIVYDKYFNQMQEPFPYYVPNFYGVLSREEVIKRLNLRIKKFAQRYGKTG